MSADLLTRARRAALEQYAHAHDAWSEREQLAALEGDVAYREECHRYAVMVLKAYRLELDDPKEKEAG